MSRKTRFVLLAAALLIGAACKPALPKAPPPVGRFFLHEPVFGGEPGSAPQELVIDSSGWAYVPGVCGEARGDYRRDGDRILVRVAWESCAGHEGRTVRFLGELVAVSLGTISGEVFFPNFPQPVPVNATKGYGSSLRMVTYNTQALPSTFHVGTIESTHEAIADEILKAGYDVVALNEIFDEDIREVYVNALSGEFPYYVSRIYGTNTEINEDSGLMLFSRWPVASLPSEEYVTAAYNTVPQSPPTIGYPVECDGNVCDKTAAIEFEACVTDDCFAEKGAGLVRVRNPETLQVTNVVFTHLQASYVPLTQEAAQDSFTMRWQQLRAIQDMIEETLNHGADGLRHFDREPVFVMGDLNMDGDLTDHDLGPNHLDTQNLFEWNVHFESPFGFYDGKMKDGWATANAPKIPSGNFDRGITRIAQWEEHDGARYDYIAWNHESRVCLQHMTLAHNLRLGAGMESGFGPTGIGDGGWMDLSDHYGVNVDVNGRSQHCSPATAESVDPASGVFTNLSGTLNRPGQIRWYRFESAGTYSFEMKGAAGADFRVYESDDLTTPAPNYKHETTDVFVDGGGLKPDFEFHGEQFRISEPPFYVRVWIPDRAATGDYQLVAIKHDCATKELACALAPGERVPHEMAANPPVGQPDEAWFELYTEEIPDGRSQQLGFAVGQIDPQAAADRVFHLEVYRDDNGQESFLGNGEDRADHWDDDPWADDLRSLVYESEQSDKVKYWMRVRREPPYAAPYPPEATFFDVRWQTNLKILYGAAYGGANSLQLFCSEQNDPFFDDGADEIYIDWMNADGAQVLGETWVGDYDDGMQISLETIVPQPLYFFDFAELRLREYDDGLNGGDDTGSGVAGSDFVIGPLESGPLTEKSVIHLEDGGKYLFFYNLRRGFDF